VGEGGRREEEGRRRAGRRERDAEGRETYFLRIFAPLHVYLGYPLEGTSHSLNDEVVERQFGPSLYSQSVSLLLPFSSSFSLLFLPLSPPSIKDQNLVPLKDTKKNRTRSLNQLKKIKFRNYFPRQKKKIPISCLRNFVRP
jgi:hypothetical protein